MITDKIKNIDIYENIPQSAKDFIKNLSADISLGRYELSDNNYVNIETYQTKPLQNAKYESHNKYADIQILLSGQERIYYKERENLVYDNPYNEEKDIGFYKETVNGDYIILDGTNFMMLFPHEAHAPQVQSENKSEKVKKVVLKIEV